jgi:hypothetical protein
MEKTMNKINLQREITVECFEVLGTVGLPQKREYILFILRIAGQRGVVTPADVSRELLGNGRLNVAARLLGQCDRLGLLKEDSRDRYSLTETGHETLEKGKVYVEVDSVWRIWTTSDELVSQKVLLIEEVDERQNGRQQGGDQKDIPSQSISQTLKEAQHKILSIPFGEHKSCTLNLKDKCIPRKDLAKTAELHVDVEDERAVVLLELNGKTEQTAVLDKQRPEVIDELMQKSSHGPKWDQQYQLLRTGFTGLIESEIASMQKSFLVLEPELDGLGAFKPIDFLVNIYPETKADTDRWADWFLSRNISTFVINGEYELWKQDAAEKFPLESPQFKSLTEKQSDFISMNDGRRTKEFWYLAAAADWNL